MGEPLQLVFETIRQKLATDFSMFIGSSVESLMAAFIQNVCQGKNVFGLPAAALEEGGEFWETKPGFQHL